METKPVKRAGRKPQDPAERKAAIAAYVDRVVDAAPPLTLEQRDKLALLLQPGIANSVDLDSAADVLDEMENTNGG